MRKVREILRLRHEQGLTQRQISASTGVSKGAVGEYLRRAQEAGLTWEEARPLDDGEVEARLFRHPGRNEPSRRVPIDFSWIHRELRRTGVTLQQLWIEYREAAARAGVISGATPYSYSQFCRSSPEVGEADFIGRGQALAAAGRAPESAGYLIRNAPDWRS